MIEILKKYRNFAFIVLVLVLLFAGYSIFFVDESGTEGPLVATTGPGGRVGQEVIATLARVQAIRLETTLFSNSAFQSLVDFGQIIPPEPVGRPNPFAPLGR
jgi:hypothetical protein